MLSRWFRRSLAWLQRSPEAVLVAGAVWTTFLPLLYGLRFESHSYQPMMLWGGVLLAFALVLWGWAHPLLYLIGAFFVSVINAVYALVAHMWHIGDLDIRVETALDSSPGESSEFIRQFVLQSKFAWALWAYVLVALALGGVYWFVWRKKRRHAWRWRGLAAVAAVAVVALGWVVVREYPAVRLSATTYRIYTRVNPILARKEYVENFMATAPPLDCDAPFDKVVFVLGESANRDYMHAYGFPLPTTPFLDGLQDKVLVRAISPANQTMSAVPIIMTPATVHDYDAFYTNPSIVSDLRRCGYETYWLSNQLRYSPYTSSVSSIASEADVVRFVLEELNPDHEPPDGILFQLFSPDDVVPGKKQAFFFHLLGSHYEWEKRYPPDKALIAQPKDLLDEYANTIYYTDYFLSQVFALFQDHSENMLFIYVSDHGEWMMPDRGGHASSNPLQEEYRVPLVFWATDPAVLQPIAQATNGRLVNTETLDVQVRFLLGLETDPGISYSTEVLSLGPGRIREYLDMPDLGYHETP
ncbi:MAG: phosphoethanolamine transferase [Chloroflexi bacterium]|nr:phosphoethanolamine transferase [Chloroflexota bacterium]